MSAAPEQKPRGRKPSPDGRTALVQIRAKPDDKARWQELASAAGQTLSAWMAGHLNKARK